MKRLLSGLLFLLPLAANAEGILYVQSAKAKILASPRFDAAVVTEASRGDELALVESQARWNKVTVAGKTGWVSKFLVSDRAPLNRVTVLGGDEEAIDANARRRASVVTTAGAARGLSGDERMRANNASVANYRAVEVMEKIRVSDEEASSFLSEGLKQ